MASTHLYGTMRAISTRERSPAPLSDNVDNTPVYVSVALSSAHVLAALAIVLGIYFYNSVVFQVFAFGPAFFLGTGLSVCSPLFLDAARKAFGALEVTPDLAGMKASWGAQPRVYALIHRVHRVGLVHRGLLGDGRVAFGRPFVDTDHCGGPGGVCGLGRLAVAHGARRDARARPVHHHRGNL